MDIIRTSENIVVGQFYKALGADGYYYVGIQFGKKKRLVVVNMCPSEVWDTNDPLFDDDPYMYRQWIFIPCTQEEVMNSLFTVEMPTQRKI